MIDIMKSDSKNGCKDMCSGCGMPTEEVVTGREMHVSTVAPEFGTDGDCLASERAGVDRQAAWGTL